jgi:hypothetical protein
MIPRGEVRFVGTGGGGISSSGGVSPFVCNQCGKTVGRKSIMDSVDVCKACRLGLSKKKRGGKRG